MARLLLVDADGRRRVRVEVLAGAAGHRTYSAGSVEEARRMALVYVPDAVIAAGDLPDGSVADLVAALRAAGPRSLADVPIVTPEPSSAQAGVHPARGSRPQDLLAAAAAVLAAEPTA